MSEVRVLAEAKSGEVPRLRRSSVGTGGAEPVKSNNENGPLVEMLNPEMFDLIRAYRCIPDARIRRHVLDLIKAAAADPAEAGE